MVPCPWFNDIADWYKKNPNQDIGLHLTLTSEWKQYRWGPVSNELINSNIIDSDGYLWRRVEDVVSRVSVNDIETEIRAQINRARQFGIEPGHIDTHMGLHIQNFIKIRITYLDMAHHNHLVLELDIFLTQIWIIDFQLD